MPWRHLTALLVALAAPMLAGCVATQVQENTLEMVDTVSRVREVQVLRNISAAISDHDVVPTEILLSVGQATVATGASPAIGATAPGQFDISANDTWTAQWQVTPITNADDLRRLRNLYVLLVSTDEQYDSLEAYYKRHPEMRAPLACYGLAPQTRDGANSSAPKPDPAAQIRQAASAASDTLCPAGYGTGVIPKWKQGLEIIEAGDSIGCKLYQEATLARRRSAEGGLGGLPFKRWLFWRKPDGAWQPTAPDTTPEALGTFGGWQLGTTSRACFNDFVLLVQSATPEAANAGAQGARLMLSTQ